MLFLLLVAFVAAIVTLVARAPQLVRTLAVPIVAAATLTLVTIAPAPVVAVAGVTLAVVTIAAVADAGVRYNLSKLIPMPMATTYGVVHPDGTTTPERTLRVQWRSHVMLHRSCALA